MCVCVLLLPGCQSITAPILLGRDAEPWVRRGGLFGELQVRECPSLWGLKEPLGNHYPNPANLGRQSCPSAVVPGVSGVFPGQRLEPG